MKDWGERGMASTIEWKVGALSKNGRWIDGEENGAGMPTYLGQAKV